MNQIQSFILVRQRIEKEFYGLPHFHFSIVCTLLSYSDIYTGNVEGLSYKDLSLLLSVKSRSGRKVTTPITKQTVRNAIITIERECGDHFKVVTEGQNLKFQFPELPKLLTMILENTEVNTVLYAEKVIDTTGVSCEFDVLDNTDLNIEVDTPNDSVKSNIIYNIKNKTNKNNFTLRKNFISDDFYPSDELIHTAKSRGFIWVESPEEIQKFIAYNKSKQAQWADFNPIYLKWLERKSEYQSKLNQARTTYEHGSNSKHYQQSAFAAVCAHHNIDQASVWGESSSENEFGEEGYIISMGEDVGDVWRAIY